MQLIHNYINQKTKQTTLYCHKLDHQHHIDLTGIHSIILCKGDLYIPFRDATHTQLYYPKHRTNYFVLSLARLAASH